MESVAMLSTHQYMTKLCQLYIDWCEQEKENGEGHKFQQHPINAVYAIHIDQM